MSGRRAALDAMSSRFAQLLASARAWRDNPGMNASTGRPPASPPSARLRWALGTGLALAVVVAGAPGLPAPWLQGDEQIFIVDNPLVNPGAAEAGAPASLGVRLTRIFASVHDDLYQPVPIATYALQWAVVGDAPFAFRLLDVLLHVANALLLWALLTRLLHDVPGIEPGLATLTGWALALLWALHPALVSTYAADMGRTHLLAALFALVAFLLHLHCLRSGRQAAFILSLVAVVLAMLCKPIVGWVLVGLVLEAALRGASNALRSWRSYALAVLAVGAGVLTYRTTAGAGLLDTTAGALFGDPISRAAFAVWLYARNVVIPVWLAYIYLPDPATGWANMRVWGGVLLFVGSVVGAIRAWERQRPPWRAVGWTWFWALLFPTLGLIGAREIAAADRYLYLPLMGIVIVVAPYASRAIAALGGPGRQRLTCGVVAVAGLMAVLMLTWDLPLVGTARTNVQRNRQLVNAHPGDPRALESLAAACQFARTNPLPAIDRAGLGSDEQFAHFNALLAKTANEAADANVARFIRDPANRAAFFRRLSLRLLTAGQGKPALVQARRAVDLEPDSFSSWKRVAHAHRALGQFQQAAEAYERCEEQLPADAEIRAVHFTDYGNLLRHDLGRDQEACAKYGAAMETGRPPLDAVLGWGLCEVRYGSGVRGFELISQVLEARPTDVRAGLALAEFHLRSHHWPQAEQVYAAILNDQPTLYPALRGYHEVCLQTGRYRQAVTAWQEAVQRLPTREFEGYLAWSLAIAGASEADAVATGLLAQEPNQRLACLAMMLLAVRAGEFEAALDWIRRASAGPPVPQARALERASATLRLLREREELPGGPGKLAEAAIWSTPELLPQGRDYAVALLREVLAERESDALGSAAGRLLGILEADSVPEVTPDESN